MALDFHEKQGHSVRQFSLKVTSQKERKPSWGFMHSMASQDSLTVYPERSVCWGQRAVKCQVSQSRPSGFTPGLPRPQKMMTSHQGWAGAKPKAHLDQRVCSAALPHSWEGSNAIFLAKKTVVTSGPHLSYFLPRAKSGKPVTSKTSEDQEVMGSSTREMGQVGAALRPQRPRATADSASCVNGAPHCPPPFFIIPMLIPGFGSVVGGEGEGGKLWIHTTADGIWGKLGQSSSQKRSNAYGKHEHRVPALTFYT